MQYIGVFGPKYRVAQQKGPDYLNFFSVPAKRAVHSYSGYLGIKKLNMKKKLRI